VGGVGRVGGWRGVVFQLWVLVLNGIIWFHGRTSAQEPAASTSPL
jgi:hypothetical protein